jgi:hypothetical protein
MNENTDNKMKNLINLEVGDSSDTGHGIHTSYVIRSNFSKKEINKSYKTAVKNAGFDLVKKICAEYEDYQIPEKYREKLLAIPEIYNLLKSWQEESDVDEEVTSNSLFSFDVEDHSWVEIFLAFTKFGNPNFEYEILDNSELETINIGGYGLFY